MSRAVFGKGLSTELRGGGEQSVGGMKANLTGNALEIATEIGVALPHRRRSPFPMQIGRHSSLPPPTLK